MTNNLMSSWNESWFINCPQKDLKNEYLPHTVHRFGACHNMSQELSRVGRSFGTPIPKLGQVPNSATYLCLNWVWFQAVFIVLLRFPGIFFCTKMVTTAKFRESVSIVNISWDRSSPVIFTVFYFDCFLLHSRLLWIIIWKQQGANFKF